MGGQPSPLRTFATLLREKLEVGLMLIPVVQLEHHRAALVRMVGECLPVEIPVVVTHVLQAGGADVDDFVDLRGRRIVEVRAIHLVRSQADEAGGIGDRRTVVRDPPLDRDGLACLDRIDDWRVVDGREEAVERATAVTVIETVATFESRLPSFALKVKLSEPL